MWELDYRLAFLKVKYYCESLLQLVKMQILIQSELEFHTLCFHQVNTQTSIQAISKPSIDGPRSECKAESGNLSNQDRTQPHQLLW